jgi:hypothetical protein
MRFQPLSLSPWPARRCRATPDRCHTARPPVSAQSTHYSSVEPSVGEPLEPPSSSPCPVGDETVADTYMKHVKYLMHCLNLMWCVPHPLMTKFGESRKIGLSGTFGFDSFRIKLRNDLNLKI